MAFTKRNIIYKMKSTVSACFFKIAFSKSFAFRVVISIELSEIRRGWEQEWSLLRLSTRVQTRAVTRFDGARVMKVATSILEVKEGQRQRRGKSGEGTRSEIQLSRGLIQ